MGSACSRKNPRKQEGQAFTALTEEEEEDLSRCGCERQKRKDQARPISRFPVDDEDSPTLRHGQVPELLLAAEGKEKEGSSGGAALWTAVVCGLAVVGILSACVVSVSRGASPGDAMRTSRGAGVPELQNARLRITNACKDESMWIAHLGENVLDEQNLKLLPLESRDVTIPSDGLGSSTARWYSKWRCVSDGNSCAIGDSGGFGQQCDTAAGCAPPLDTKFNARFGAKGKPCNTSAGQYAGCDFVDVSLQDGYTVPFKLVIKGDCKGRYARDADKDHNQKVVDCSKLAVDRCPKGENLGQFGSDVNLQAVNPAWSSIAGCYSPCSKLTYPDWTAATKAEGRMQAKQGDGIASYCCPTLDACDGKLENTSFVHSVREMCPGLNAYDYDRGMGVGTCPAGTRYEMIFYCPSSKPSSAMAALKDEEAPQEGVTSPSAAPPAAAVLDEAVAGEEIDEHSQPTRLRITNGCDKEPVWIAQMAKHMGGGATVKLDPLQSHDFTIPRNLSSARYWPKLRCNEQGAQCSIGDSGAPGQKCEHELGCAPPIDTKFEGTFGLEGKPCDLDGGDSDGCDFVDVSLVDGYTLPFKFNIYGDCTSRFVSSTGVLGQQVDCSGLSVEECPCDEDLAPGRGVSLRVNDLNTKDAMGCYSPCSKLTYSNWQNDMALGIKPSDKDVAPFCCPTPPETPESCSAGPAKRSKYVQAVHRMCPGVHGYAYDEGLGLLTCPAGTKYEMVFYCPSETAVSCQA
mmetsp:Transcript_83147/g.238908  ORF Transcript_83147/g.238908 Transcript_83147/m.238908 type:complete len:742 (+) Transcript_83147:98-2323(+)